jgi:hypothetical protein
VLAPLAAVIVVDQAAKWWAWRDVPGAHINPGGDFLTRRRVGRWYAQPVPGALLDLLDFGLVSIATAILARRRRLAVVTTPAARNWLRLQAPVVGLAVAGLIMTVALGAAHNGRLIRPLPTSVKCCQAAHPYHR